MKRIYLKQNPRFFVWNISWRYLKFGSEHGHSEQSQSESFRVFILAAFNKHIAYILASSIAPSNVKKLVFKYYTFLKRF